VEAVSKEGCTLDTLIEEHGKYLNDITHKGLLGSGRSGHEGSLMSQVHEILKVIMNFKEGMVPHPTIRDIDRRTHYMDIMSRNLLVNNLSQHELKSELQLYIPIYSFPQNLADDFSGRMGKYSS
jgi:hypothetical protein